MQHELGRRHATCFSKDYEPDSEGYALSLEAMPKSGLKGLTSVGWQVSKILHSVTDE